MLHKPEPRVKELTFDHHDAIMDDRPHMVATAEVDGMVTRFVWKEGTGQVHIQTGNCRPFSDWNIWDYELGGPGLEFTLPAFQALVERRLKSIEYVSELSFLRREYFFPEVI